MQLYQTRIAGTGLGTPSKVLTNSDLSKIVETSDEWIVSRTGIKERKIVDRSINEGNSTLGIMAAREALERSGLKPSDIDLVIYATMSPDTVMPITAARVMHALGIPNSGAFDLNAACTGFISALHLADGLVASGKNKNVLVIAADVFSSLIDWKDRTTCVLFADGAGAAILSRAEVKDSKKDSHIMGSILHSILDLEENLVIKDGGSRSPLINSNGDFTGGNPFVQMKGQEVFKIGTRCMADVGVEVLQQCGYTAEDLTWIIPHQANLRIIEMVARLLKIPMDKVYVNVDRWGNTSAATVAIAMAEMNQKGLLKKGDLILLDVFGGGYTYGAMLLRW